MKDVTKTKAQLIDELVQLRLRVSEFEQAAGRLKKGEDDLRLVSRKTTETRQWESESRMRAMLDACTESFFLMDLDGKVLLANKTTPQRLGVDLETLLKKVNVFSFLPPDIIENRRQKIFEVQQTGQPLRFEEERYGRTFMTSYFPLRNENGQISQLAVFAMDITERKQTEKKSQEIERRISQKLDIILSPEADIKKNLELAEIIDTPTLQSLVKDFYEMTHVPIAVMDHRGRWLAGLEWQNICLNFHRVHPETCRHCIESDTQLAVGIQLGEFRLYKCKNNMWDVATPIIVGGNQIGTIFSGQFFFDDERVDYELFRSQARQYGFDERAYLTALEAVPRLSRQSVNTGMAFFAKLAHFLSQLGYSNIQQARLLAERNTFMDSLQKSEQLLNSTQGLAKIGGWEYNVESKLTTWTDEMYRIHGFEKHDFAPDSSEPLERSLACHDPETRPAMRKAVQRCSREGQPFDLEFPFTPEQGGRLWIRAVAHPVFEDGRIVKVLGNFMDMTDRKQSEEALLESERLLNATQALAKVGGWEWRVDTSTGVWTDEMYRIHDMDKRDFPRESSEPSARSLACYAPQDRPVMLDAVQRCGLYGQPFDLEFPLITEKGRHIWIRTTAQPVFRDGKIVKLVGNFMDITERKHAEEILQESEERYRSLFENNHTVMLLINPEDGRIRNANPAACAFYGWNHEDLTKKSINEINTLTPEEIKAEMQLAGEQNRNHFFFKHRTADDTIRDVEVFSGPIRVKDKTLLYSIVIDITEKKRLENELLTARKLESVGTLAGGIAHDFNNLLVAIQGYVELAAMDLPPGSQTHRYLLSAAQATVQAAELTKRLLTFSRGGAPMMKLSDLRQLVMDIVRRSVSAPVDAQFMVSSDSWPVQMDEGQMRQVFRNITENAVDAMPDGGVITVRMQNVMVTPQDRLPLTNGPYMRISLEDTGRGIPEGDLPFIFDPYYSTKQKGSQKGVGLGLAVCHSIVTKHNGCIQVESEEGKGCKVHVYIPATVEMKPSVPTVSETPNQKGKNGKRILLMDDEPLVREVGRQLLTTLGYEVETAADGMASVDLYIRARQAQQPFDLVLLDLKVKTGGMGAVQALEGLLAVDSGVKALVFSGYTDDPIFENYRQYGFLGAVAKPFNLKVLKSVIESHL